MKLNRAQLLVYDDVSINFVQTVLAVNILMCQMKLSFNAEDLLHVYTMVRPKREPGTIFIKGNHYLRLRNPRLPQMRSSARSDSLPYASMAKLYNVTISSQKDPESSSTRTLLLTKFKTGRQLLLAGEVKIAYSFKDTNDFDASLGEIHLVRFRTLGQKKSAPVVDPPAIETPPISQVSLTVPALVLALVAQVGAESNSSEVPLLDKHKGNKLTRAPLHEVQEEDRGDELPSSLLLAKTPSYGSLPFPPLSSASR
ncbi:hypothetical protein Acr_14g0004520 [Actinidia rufa]|uniref:Uncharacterized protein n=1 Tax=Actinidia rufa TaxID=165716 RepID=A0A7J0FR00_9ERIC|nr:hypothetical protein Acr_14g0004520 [Actinidia rufa]